MNGTTQVQVRSVQLAVMAAPSATVTEAVAEARRRQETSGAWNPRPASGSVLRIQAATS